MRPPTARNRWALGSMTACAAALLAGCSGASEHFVPFSDDFTGGASSAWSNDRGSWRSAGGVYDATNPNSQPPTYTAVRTRPGLGDFAVDVDVLSWNDGGVWLRSDFNGGAVNGVLFVTGGLSGAYDGFYWHVWTDGVAGPMLEQTPVAGLQGTDRHLRIEVSGDTYRAFIDGVLVSTLVDPTYATGMVGLYDLSPVSGASTPRGEAFDNFKISSLPAVP